MKKFHRLFILQDNSRAFALKICLLLCFCWGAGIAQPSQNRNYTLETIVKVPGKSHPVNLESLPVGDINRNIQYTDGLGRPLQSISWKGSAGANHDIVSPVVYDINGRETMRYLPYASASSNTEYNVNAIADQNTFYNIPPSGISINRYPYSQDRIEASAISRPLERGFPGSAWQLSNSGISGSGHTAKLEYTVNRSTDGPAVVLYRANPVSTTGQTHHRTLSNGGNFADGELYVGIIKDENWINGKAGTKWEYKDKQGRIVLIRVWETEASCLSTYYVYDLQGHLSFVLPPGTLPDGGSVNANALENYGYQYRYDGRNRLIEKRLPGKDWEWIIYGKRDEVLMVQDAVQRIQNKWIFDKYDEKGRKVITGELSSTLDRTAIQAEVNSYTGTAWEKYTGIGTYGYDNASYPQNFSKVYAVNYYDRYDFTGNTFGLPGSGQRADAFGFQTGGLVNVLGSTTMLLNVSYYDDKGRLIQQKAQNHLGGTDVNELTYNFSNNITTSNRTHVANGVTTTIMENYIYDHMGRKLSTVQSINGATPVVLSELVYNDLGQLITKRLHSVTGVAEGTIQSDITLNSADIVNAGQQRTVTASNSITLSDGFAAKEGSVFKASISAEAFLQTTNYTYNERGWMKSAKAPQFSMELEYNDSTLPQFNGNISGQSYTNGASNAFSYTYDKLNRLTNSTAGNNLGEAIAYDVMGNITSLTRDNFGTNNYTVYEGNRLKTISGFTNSNYDYDANGNLKSDSQKNITLGYNFLNLPQTVSGSQNLSYTYSAAGTKLKKQNGGTVIDYVDGIQYSNGSIDFIQTEEGIARRSGNNYSYEYNLSDHLGNVRVTFYKNPNTNQLEVLQRDDYYAFGLRKEPVAKAGLNKYLYNGKELQEELGQLDYGARFYDPVIGRWNTVDPLAEKMRRHSPYNYGFNNPIRFLDADGREPIPSQAGVILGFIRFLNNTRSKMGTLTGSQGHDAMMRLGKTEMNWAHLRPEPMTTNPFNTSRDKYIYTTKGGWLDMAHFMFYAGKAYDYKQQKETAQKAISEISKAGGYAGMGMSADLTKTADINPVAEAMQDGYRQEMSDRLVAGHSAYSYEDLPSDKLGAEFGANYYNSNSKLSLGEQLLNYVNSLGATDPKKAPNYKNLPKDDSKLDSPTETNHTAKPMYTQ
ncbi:DUF6443 domain-containing protein [Pedobacter sp. PF22-3]|uniref:RHS repeat domain-containing protein n=1 Tax=Pedobacter sp. PF22-3 TaxID=2994467 RepID=UPI002247DBF5|nr:DUF6443 domain-containing protein [Pedobacter sp. PF22-3]MCX2494075.1 DUF6443 domain-containing protein [Pedobacter sp. PF22-3]